MSGSAPILVATAIEKYNSDLGNIDTICIANSAGKVDLLISYNANPVYSLPSSLEVKKAFDKIKAKSFDYAILEKSKKINAIKLEIPWSDLGSWKEICKMYEKNKHKYFKKKNVFYYVIKKK